MVDTQAANFVRLQATANLFQKLIQSSKSVNLRLDVSLELLLAVNSTYSLNYSNRKVCTVQVHAYI